MQFRQIVAVEWNDGNRKGYSVLALGEDGQVYKSMPQIKKAQHHGWLKLSDNALPEDFVTPRPVEKVKPVQEIAAA